MRNRCVAGLAVLASLVLVAPIGAQSATGKPNVVLIMMDDLGYGDLGSYGAPDAKTPNIDRLAREGVRLTDAYANGPVCTPTRAALMTGRYQQRYGLEWVVTVTDTQAILPVTGTSLPALLKANGYATAPIGKWHLGYKREYCPLAHGFDEFFGFLEGAHDYYVAGGLYENTTPVQPRGYLTDEITDRSVAFIARQRSAPFFLEVAYNNDNGGEWLSRNAPFFHRKGTLWEGGIRVPLIMRWPGELPAGKTSAQVALTMDITASILSATGTKPPQSYRADGIDLLPVLRGRVPRIERRVFWRFPPNASPDLTPLGRQQRVVRAGHMKLLVEGGHFFLFDLAADPGERTDLAAQRPNVVRSLWGLIQEWEKSVDEERTAAKTPG